MLKQENVVYTKLNGKRAKYDLYEVNGTQITQDKSEPLFEERYRPRKIFDLILPTQIKNDLQKNVQEDNMPHMLFYSRHGGSGKTSISQVMVNEFNTDSLTISANLSGGIAAIRDKVGAFSQNVSQFGHFKILNIEEIGDSRQTEVDLFKSIVDTFGKNVRIIMTTNNMAKISQPLLTRFKFFDFNKIPDESKNDILKQIFNRIKAILTIENIEHTDNDIAVLMKKYMFSYRELLGALNSCVRENKLDINYLIESNKSDLEDILKLINDKNVGEIARIARNLNHIQILEDLNSKYLELINNIDMIQPYIMHTNNFQRDISNGIAFEEIAFLDYVIHLIKDGVTFKI